ncbi:tyrosine-protein kinase, partial [Klebsiella variicola]|uniref:Wzz/FepE/Etk N-terminal domain-containing protein n=3 Tax=Klebsiella TaxID=570 RepID=UPI001EC28BF5
MIVNKKTAEKDSDEIDLGRLIGELIDHRKLTISITALFTLLSLVYALFATPVYQADAMIQVEQKQGNAILSNLSQMLPDSQPQSAPEIALLQSRMILGKTVDDLNLQTRVKESYFPFVGEGWSRLTGEKQSTISVSRFYIALHGDDDAVKAKIKIVDSSHYILSGNGFELKGTVGELVEGHGVSIKIDAIDAAEGTTFDISSVTRLKAITDLQQIFSVSDKGKDT